MVPSKVSEICERLNQTSLGWDCGCDLTHNPCLLGRTRLIILATRAHDENWNTLIDFHSAQASFGSKKSSTDFTFFYLLK